jgi:hypothetical protein
LSCSPLPSSTSTGSRPRLGARKVEKLREILPSRYELHARDLNVPSFEKLSFDEMVRVAKGAAEKINAQLLIGSSLGALVALELDRKGMGIPLLLIAPALGFGARWVEKLPDGDPVMMFNHALGYEVPIHRAFFEDMATRTLEAVPPAPPVSIVMGEADESVPTKASGASGRSGRAPAASLPARASSRFPGAITVSSTTSTGSLTRSGGMLG